MCIHTEHKRGYGQLRYDNRRCGRMNRLVEKLEGPGKSEESCWGIKRIPSPSEAEVSYPLSPFATRKKPEPPIRNPGPVGW